MVISSKPQLICLNIVLLQYYRDIVHPYLHVGLPLSDTAVFLNCMQTLLSISRTQTKQLIYLQQPVPKQGHCLTSIPDLSWPPPPPISSTHTNPCLQVPQNGLRAVADLIRTIMSLCGGTCALTNWNNSMSTWITWGMPVYTCWRGERMVALYSSTVVVSRH